MNRTESIASWAKAFAGFQAEVQNPKLTAENPHLRNKYAPLSEVLNTVRPILAKHGLSVHQDVANMEDKVCVTTTIYHESGEYLESSPLCIPFSRGGKLADAQVIGAAISYGKRYGLQAALGVAADEEDDGASLANNSVPQHVPTNLVGTPSKATLAAKYQLGKGTKDGFEEYYKKMVEQGWDDKHISLALDKALQAQKNKEPQPTN